MKCLVLLFLPRSETETKIVDLNNEVESLKSKLTQQNEAECKEVNIVRKTLDLLEQDREKLLNTVEPLMKANKDLQESLEGVANELKQKNDEIKKLRASSVNVKREMEIEAVAMETKVDDVRKEFDREMKDVKKNHKKEVAKVEMISPAVISQLYTIIVSTINNVRQLSRLLSKFFICVVCFYSYVKNSKKC